MRSAATHPGWRRPSGWILAVALAGVFWSQTRAVEDAPASRETPPEWGLYQILWSRAYGDQLSKEVATFASKPDYVMFYRDLGRRFPKFAIDRIAVHNATTIVSLELWEWHGNHAESYLPAIIAGQYDTFLRRWAQDAKADGRRLLLRFGFEFNGNWFSWSGDPDAFVRAWRRAHGIFKDVGAENVEWVWAPNVVGVPDTQANGMHKYYPGDEYVDWVGVDGYNFGDKHDRWHRWQSFDDIFDDVLADYSKRYGSKPIMIAEFGCAPGEPEQRAAWIRDAHRSVLRRPQVRATIWFNYDKRREHEPNWRIDATRGALRAFNETFARPRAVGRKPKARPGAPSD